MSKIKIRPSLRRKYCQICGQENVHKIDRRGDTEMIRCLGCMTAKPYTIREKYRS